MHEFFEGCPGGAMMSALLTQLPDKRLLQVKLHQFHQLDAADRGDEA